MRKFSFLFIGLFIPMFLISQDTEEKKTYMMWETMYITPDYTDLAGFSAAMTAHNKAFHSEGAYTANVYNVVTGPNTGKMMWSMGPCMYADLDDRPGDDGHNEDWANNVMPHVKKLHQGEYWQMDAELSNLTPGSRYNIYRVRFHEVNNGEGYRIKGVLKKISAAVKAMDGENPWGIFYNEFQQGNDIGRHIATVSYYNSWAEFDEDGSFRDAYVKVHGDGSWVNFLDEYDSVFSNSWDEIWEHNAEMSGPTKADDDDGN